MNRRLLEVGADVDAYTKTGDTALLKASSKGYAEVVLLLLEAGADVNIQDQTGITALRLASEGRHEVVIRLLNDAGARD